MTAICTWVGHTTADKLGAGLTHVPVKVRDGFEIIRAESGLLGPDHAGVQVHSMSESIITTYHLPPTGQKNSPG